MLCCIASQGELDLRLSDTSTDGWKPKQAEKWSRRGVRLQDATALQTAQPAPCPLVA